MTRVLPHNLEAERQLLGCCMRDGSDALPKAIGAQVRPDSFYDPKHANVFGLLLEMAASGATINDATVFQELMHRKLLDHIGGQQEFFQITSSTPTAALASQVIRIVSQLATVRRVIRIAAGMTERAYDYAGGEVADVLSEPLSDLLALSNSDGKPEPTWAETIDQAEAVADELIANQGKPLAASIEFPWEGMNKLFGPMQRGQLVVVAARTSIGKSSLARPIACHAARKGLKVYFDSIEVKGVQVALQMAATLSCVGVRQLGQSTETDKREFKSALKGLRTLGITMSRKDRSIAQIIGRAKALASQGKIDIAIIDHGGYIDEIAKAGYGEKVSVIGTVTKALKNLAVDLNIPVVLLWQLNRGPDKEQNREPVLSDLKDSGSVEEDADKVIFIHRPSENPITNRAQSLVSTIEECPRFFQNVIQAKGRDDGTTLLSFYFERQTATFYPIQK